MPGEILKFANDYFFSKIEWIQKLPYKDVTFRMTSRLPDLWLWGRRGPRGPPCHHLSERLGRGDVWAGP